mgnify:CR=1 FL=1
MTLDKREQKQAVCIAPIIVLAMVLVGNSALSATLTYTYDVSTATAGNSLDGNDNWSLSGGGSSGTIENSLHPTGFSGNYLATNGAFSSTWTRPNDSSFTYSIPDSALSVTLSFVLSTERTNDLNWIGLAGAGTWRFGQRDRDGWGYRTDSAGVVELGNPSGDGQLTNSVKDFNVSVEMDLISDQFDFIVDDLNTAGAGPQVIVSNEPLVDFDTPSQFDELFIRGGKGAEFDEITISYFIPEPTSMALLTFGTLTLLSPRRRVWA